MNEMKVTFIKVVNKLKEDVDLSLCTANNIPGFDFNPNSSKGELHPAPK